MTSASTPRCRKMSTAAGESWSAMRTRGHVGCPSMRAPPRLLGEGRDGQGAHALLPRRAEGRAAQAACSSSAATVAKAQSSQGVSASRSEVSTVAPHQMRRPGGRVAIAADVEGHAFLLQQAGQLLGEVGLGVVGERGDRAGRPPSGTPRCWSGSPGPRPGSRPRRSCATQASSTAEVGVGAALQLGQAADRGGPLQGVEIVLDAQHRGRVDGRALEDVER